VSAVYGPQEATWGDVFAIWDRAAEAAEAGDAAAAETLRNEADAIMPAACASYRLAESGTRALSEADKAGMTPRQIEFMDRPGFADAPAAADVEAGQ
jgi:hypothetical protein